MDDLPAFLRGQPFTTGQALAAGITRKMLRGPRFRQLHRGVHIAAGVREDAETLRSAARLAMPEDARLSHVSRIQAAGIDVGGPLPVHFTVARDLHLARTQREIVLHRTEVMPPTDEVGVRPGVALLQYASQVRPIEVVRVADRLLSVNATSRVELAELATAQTWRPGASSLRWCLGLMNERSASSPETDCRVYLVVTGLPEPLANVPVLDSPDSPIADLWLPEFRLCIEHEGRHHFTDESQVKRDVWRYAVMRDHEIAYLQIHRAILRNPRQYVLLVHQALVNQGYDGPPPSFGREWNRLFTRGR